MFTQTQNTSNNVYTNTKGRVLMCTQIQRPK